MAKSFRRGRENKHAVNSVTTSPKYNIPASNTALYCTQHNTHTRSYTEFHSKTLFINPGAFSGTKHFG